MGARVHLAGDTRAKASSPHPGYLQPGDHSRAVPLGKGCSFSARIFKQLVSCRKRKESPVLPCQRADSRDPGCAQHWPPSPCAPHPWTAASAAVTMRQGRNACASPRARGSPCDRTRQRFSLLCQTPQPPGLLAPLCLHRPGHLSSETAGPGSGCLSSVPQQPRSRAAGGAQLGRGSYFFFSRRSFSAWDPSLVGTMGSCTPSSESVSRAGREAVACQ